MIFIMPEMDQYQRKHLIHGDSQSQSYFMTSIRKWFINFNDNLTNLTFHSSSNFHYQIVSAQSIQKKNKLCLTSLMSMKSALSLSSQNIILIGFMYIYHHLFTICTICRTKISWKINIPLI